MHKHWIAMLSIAGFAGSTVPVKSQPLDDNKATTEKKTDKSAAKTNAAGKVGKKNNSSGKLAVKQQTVRQQNQPSAPGKQTVGPGNKQITKGNKAQITKGNNAQVTKGSKDPELTKKQ